MIPRLLLRVLCRKAEILMSLIYQISVLWHSSPLRHNLLFFPMMIMNGDIFVIDFWFDAKTINLDLFSTSNSSSIICFPFLRWCTLDFGFETKRWLYGAMYNSSPSLSPLTTECQHGRYLHFGVSPSESIRNSRRISRWTQASHQGWFTNETTVWNTTTRLTH